MFVESESKKVGALQLPDALVARMRDHSRCLRVEMNDAARVRLLLEEYGFFANQAERFCALLDALIELQGKERVKRWQSMARAGQWAEVFDELMREHYDPLYERSMKRNFSGLEKAAVDSSLPTANPQRWRAPRANCSRNEKARRGGPFNF